MGASESIVCMVVESRENEARKTRRGALLYLSRACPTSRLVVRGQQVGTAHFLMPAEGGLEGAGLRFG